MNAIQTTSIGGPEVLEHRTVPIHFRNVVRSSFWFIPRALLHRRVLPRWPLQGPIAVDSWSKGIGIHCSLREGVSGFEMSDPVAWFGPLSSYAQRAIVPADRIVRVPDGVNMEAAAALMMQGATAYYLSQLTYSLKPGDTTLIHAAAEGVGFF